MNNKNQLKNFFFIKKNINERNKIILNSIIGLLLFLIAVLSFSLFIKLKKLNEFKSLNNSNYVSAKPIQVEVLNGCGISGAADKVTDFLRNKKYDVVQMGNYRTFNMDESIIIDRKGNIKIAQDIADSLGLDKKNVIQQINKNYLLDISIIVGKDYKQFVLKN